MPRRSSSGRFSSRSYSKSTPKHKSPKSVKPAPPPTPAPAQVVQASNGSNIAGAVADGASWGFGSAIGRRAADAIMGPRVVKHETVTSGGGQETAPIQGMDSLACAAPIKSFQECLNLNTSDISKCQLYMDKLTECSRKSGSPLGV